MVDRLFDLPTDPPSLYLDVEGINLSRTGTVSLLTILVHCAGSSNQAYLVDINSLGAAAFSTPSSSGETLAGILEAPTIPKVFFDVRNDSDALHFHYGIFLRGVFDIQLMENASRSPGSSKQLLNGLKRCIKYDLYLSHPDSNAWNAAKRLGKKSMNFNERPLPEEVKDYCVGDVRYMPRLWQLYWRKLDEEWKQMVAEETEKRVQLSQSPDYEPHGQHKVLGPWGELSSGELSTPSTRRGESKWEDIQRLL